MPRGRRLNRQRPPEPVRRCIGCREAHPAHELLRVALREGAAVPDHARILPGRGAWICRKARCVEIAIKGRQLSRSLKGKVREPSVAELSSWISVVLPLTPAPASS